MKSASEWSENIVWGTYIDGFGDEESDHEAFIRAIQSDALREAAKMAEGAKGFTAMKITADTLLVAQSVANVAKHRILSLIHEQKGG